MKNSIKKYMNRDDVFPYRLKAVYSIEAAAVMGICMIFIGLLFMGGIHLYGSAMGTLTSYECNYSEPQDVFRLSRAAGDMVSAYKDKGVEE